METLDKEKTEICSICGQPNFSTEKVVVKDGNLVKGKSPVFESLEDENFYLRHSLRNSLFVEDDLLAIFKDFAKYSGHDPGELIYACAVKYLNNLLEDLKPRNPDFVDRYYTELGLYDFLKHYRGDICLVVPSDLKIKE